MGQRSSKSSTSILDLPFGQGNFALRQLIPGFDLPIESSKWFAFTNEDLESIDSKKLTSQSLFFYLLLAIHQENEVHRRKIAILHPGLWSSVQKIRKEDVPKNLFLHRWNCEHVVIPFEYGNEWACCVLNLEDKHIAIFLQTEGPLSRRASKKLKSLCKRVFEHCRGTAPGLRISYRRSLYLAHRRFWKEHYPSGLYVAEAALNHFDGCAMTADRDAPRFRAHMKKILLPLSANAEKILVYQFKSDSEIDAVFGRLLNKNGQKLKWTRMNAAKRAIPDKTGEATPQKRPTQGVAISPILQVAPVDNRTTFERLPAEWSGLFQVIRDFPLNGGGGWQDFPAQALSSLDGINWVDSMVVFHYLLLQIARFNSTAPPEQITTLLSPFAFHEHMVLNIDEICEMRYLARRRFELAVIPINCGGNHWAVAVLHVRSTQLFIFDSLLSTSIARFHAYSTAVTIADGLLRIRGMRGPPYVSYAPPDRQTSQTDGNSCGLFTMWNALRAIAQLPQCLPHCPDVRMEAASTFDGSYEVRIEFNPSEQSVGVQHTQGTVEVLTTPEQQRHEVKEFLKAVYSIEGAAVRQPVNLSRRLSQLELAATPTPSTPRRKRTDLSKMTPAEKAEHRRKQKLDSANRNKDKHSERSQTRRDLFSDCLNLARRDSYSERNADRHTVPSKMCRSKIHPGKGCGAMEAGHLSPYFNVGEFSTRCPHCDALLLECEQGSALCCAQGKVDLRATYNSLQDVPPLIRELFEHENRQLARKFLAMDRQLNQIFAFASISTSSSAPLPGGPQPCKLNGEITTFLSGLFPPAGKLPEFAQIYTLTSAAAAERHFDRAFPNQDTMLANNLQNCQRLISVLEEVLQHYHPYSSLYKTFHDMYKEAEAQAAAAGSEMPQIKLTILSNRQARMENIADATVHSHRTDLPEGTEHVGVVWMSATGEPPKFKGLEVKTRQGGLTTIDGSSMNPILFPACFPVLNPKGILGFRFGIPLAGYDSLDDEAIDQDEEFQDEEPEEDGGFLPNNGGRPPRKGKRRFVSARQFYRYLFFSRGSLITDFHWLFSHEQLAEYAIIIICNQIERHEMDYRKQVQERTNLRASLPAELIRGVERGLQPGETLGKVYLAPITWKGSRGYMQNAYSNLKTISCAIGKVALFVTFTGNPEWPEIQESLSNTRHKGSWIHNSMIVARVFRAKLREFMKDLTERHVLGNVAGWGYSIEFQKRGMPHAHILLIMERDVPVQTTQYVESYISAEIPDLPASDDVGEWAEQQRRLHRLVTKNNLHDCGPGCRLDGRCSKRFPKPYSEDTVLETNDYPLYKRRAPPAADAVLTDEERQRHGNEFAKKMKDGTTVMLDNRHVVPYNAFLTCKFECHINVEFVGVAQCPEYVFKYMMKGHDRAYVRVQGRQGRQELDANGNAIVNYDEMEHNFRVRYMASPEAMWRMLSYETVRLSHEVMVIYVYKPNGGRIVYEEGQEEQAAEQAASLVGRNMLTDFFKLCDEDPEARQYCYHEIPLHYAYTKKNGWKKRVRQRKTIVRLGTVVPTDRLGFSLRLLLLNKPGPRSYEDLCTVNGTYYRTFPAAAHAMGLSESNEMWQNTLRDADNEFQSSRRFRRFFAMLLHHCLPSDPEELLHLHHQQLINPVQAEFVRWLGDVGNGRNMVDDASSHIAIPNGCEVQRLNDLVDFVFPNQALADPINKVDDLRSSGILCTRNETVFEVNELLLARIPTVERTYESIDNVIMDPHEQAAALLLDVYADDLNMESINRMTPTGLPPHKLNLKVGAIIMLIRNMSGNSGLCNGSMFQVVEMADNLLKCRRLEIDDRFDEFIYLPRVKFEFGTGLYDRTVKFSRLQFPVRLAFANTINKAQGQTLKRVGLYFHGQQAFGHGQLYTAFSRVRNLQAIRVLSIGLPRPGQLRNVVFKELLL